MVNVLTEENKLPEVIEVDVVEYSISLVRVVLPSLIQPIPQRTFTVFVPKFPKLNDVLNGVVLILDTLFVEAYNPVFITTT